jgi:hypothetical protein
MDPFLKIENLVDYSSEKLKEVRSDVSRLRNVPNDTAHAFEKYNAIVSYMIGELNNTLNAMDKEGGGRRKTRKARKSRRKH